MPETSIRIRQRTIVGASCIDPFSVVTIEWEKGVHYELKAWPSGRIELCFYRTTFSDITFTANAHNPKQSLEEEDK